MDPQKAKRHKGYGYGWESGGEVPMPGVYAVQSTAPSHQVELDKLPCRNHPPAPGVSILCTPCLGYRTCDKSCSRCSFCMAPLQIRTFSALPELSVTQTASSSPSALVLWVWAPLFLSPLSVFILNSACVCAGVGGEPQGGGRGVGSNMQGRRASHVS